ncbi:CLUMA_CG009745, isoform A [Clunio marinus]|uniref:CLUMA_CG009745, isoform A n=1 Tax=Clunio marinus TaxID=568069 RepID=A0A1J1IBH0_9DIPT|nr:CLUMA_CG009745, isoform A [Clunio marinus]
MNQHFQQQANRQQNMKTLYVLLHLDVSSIDTRFQKSLITWRAKQYITAKQKFSWVVKDEFLENSSNKFY